MHKHHGSRQDTDSVINVLYDRSMVLHSCVAAISWHNTVAADSRHCAVLSLVPWPMI